MLTESANQIMIIRYVVVDVFRHEIVKFVKFWPFRMFKVLIGVD